MLRIANHAIVLHRQGKRYTVKPGEEVDLTQAELDDIKATAPDALRKSAAEVATPKANVPPAVEQQSSGRGKGGKNAGEKLDKPAGGDNKPADPTNDL